MSVDNIEIYFFTQGGCRGVHHDSIILEYSNIVHYCLWMGDSVHRLIRLWLYSHISIRFYANVDNQWCTNLSVDNYTAYLVGFKLNPYTLQGLV